MFESLEKPSALRLTLFNKCDEQKTTLKGESGVVPRQNLSHSMALPKFSLVLASAVLAGCGLGSSTDNTKFCPVTSDGAVAYVKRPLLFDDNDPNALQQDDLRQPQAFRPGARLFLKASTLPDAQESDITSSVFAGAEFLNDDGELLYDVKDLSVSADGSQLVFAMRAPEDENLDEDEQPKWNIWRYDLTTCSLEPVIPAGATAEAGHDISPAFLPDGRIIYASTRQQTGKAILLDEGKPQYSALVDERALANNNIAAFSLHVMESDGSNIQQLTFNQSHDLDPVVMPDGRIVFSRWDNQRGTRNNGYNLYRINPNGYGLEYLYGRHSHDSGDDGSEVQYIKPSLAANGQIISSLRDLRSSSLATRPSELDIDFFIEADLDTRGNAGVGQQALIDGLRTDASIGLAGAYANIFPLNDGSSRLLASYSPCRVRATLPPDAAPGTVNTALPEACSADKLADSANFEAAPPLYGLWLRDGDTQRPIVLGEEGQMISEAVLVSSSRLPTFIGHPSLDSEAETLAQEGLGVISIRSVYDIDGQDTSPAGIAALADPVQTPPNMRPVQFVRIEKAVSIPDDQTRDFDNSAFGNNQRYMREILGYAPVEPDGSVQVAVPANVAFNISLLDGNGRRLASAAPHFNWLSVAPGETLSCKGCHTATSELPHGRHNAGPDSAHAGAPTTGAPYPNTEAALFADLGDSMAEIYTRVRGLRRLSPDIVYQDDWSASNKAAAFSFVYADLSTAPPIAQAACETTWSSLCRVTINYPEHIHPLWSVDRRVYDNDGVTLVQDNTCTTCHNNVDAMDVTQIPAAQLDLSNGASDIEANQFKSYRELLFADNQQEIVGGLLQDVMVDSGNFQTDPDTGELILDENDNPIPILVPVNVASSLNFAGANSALNAQFFARFATGGAHADYLSAAELRLLSEWLDIGAQYWNNPFALGVPLN